MSILRKDLLHAEQPKTAHNKRARPDLPGELEGVRYMRQEVQDQALPHKPPASGARHPTKATADRLGRHGHCDDGKFHLNTTSSVARSVITKVPNAMLNYRVSDRLMQNALVSLKL